MSGNQSVAVASSLRRHAILQAVAPTQGLPLSWNCSGRPVFHVQSTSSAAASPSARSRAASRAGGNPNWRAYSRLNWEALS
jgi:hypothetical protein